MLQEESGVASGQVICRFKSNVVKNERTDDTVDRADAQLMETLRPQALRDSQQPLNVLAVRWIASVLRLRPIVVNSSCQGLQCQHTDTISSNQRSQLLRAEGLTLSMDLRE